MPRATHRHRNESSAGANLPRLAVSYALAAGLLFAAVYMIKSALASRYSDRAEATMMYWSSPQRKRAPVAAEIAYLQKLLDRSLALAPGNPTHHDRLGQLYLWELATQEVSDARRRQLRDLGLAAARYSVARQPGWALSWARLLVWKAEFNELDKEFRVALERATTLGQWQINIHGAVLHATLPVWDDMSPADHELILRTGLRGLQQTPVYTVSVLKEFDRLADVCRLIGADDPLRLRHCTPAAAAKPR